MPKGVYVHKKRGRVSAVESNAQGIPCVRGHVGYWREDRKGLVSSRACKLCQRIHNKKTMYGLDEETFRLMVEFQKGKCAVCGRPEKLYVDHCHKTGKVRGLLCNKCNLQLGLIESGFLDVAQSYLQRYSTDSEPEYASGRVIKDK